MTVQDVHEQAVILRTQVINVLEKIVSQGFLPPTSSRNMVALISIMFSDSLGDLSNLVERYDMFEADGVRAMAIHHIKTRLEGAQFIAGITIDHNAELPYHSAYLVDCVLAVKFAKRLCEVWENYSQPSSTEQLDRAQSMLSMLRVAPTENE